MAQVAGTPSLNANTWSEMATVRVKVKSLTSSKAATGSLTVMLNVRLLEPPLLLANTVNSVVLRFTSGVPDSVPFSNVRPYGTAGWMPQISVTPPEVCTVRVVIESLRV